MNEAYIDKIHHKIYDCFKTTVIRKMESSGNLDDFRDMVEAGEDNVFTEIREFLYEWCYDTYMECAIDVCYKNAHGIVETIKADKKMYQIGLDNIASEYDVPTDEKDLAFKLIDCLYIDVSPGYDGWADYAIYDVASKIYDMVS